MSSEEILCRSKKDRDKHNQTRQSPIKAPMALQPMKYEPNTGLLVYYDGRNSRQHNSKLTGSDWSGNVNCTLLAFVRIWLLAGIGSIAEAYRAAAL